MRGCAGLRPQHHGSGYILAQSGVRRGKCYRLRNGRMLEQNLVDLRRSDLLAAAIDDLARTTDQKKVAVFIEKSDIAGPEPFSRKRCLRRARVAVVACQDALTTDDDLARLATWQQISAFVH